MCTHYNRNGQKRQPQAWQPLLPNFVDLGERATLTTLAQEGYPLPKFVQESAVGQRYLKLLGQIDWQKLPERAEDKAWPGPPPHPCRAYVGALLIKTNEQITYMTQLRQYLVENPALIWLLGFRLVPSEGYSWGFDAEASLPCARHFSRILRELSNEALQFLLTETVQVLQRTLPPEVDFGQVISLDTKHILAWVKENNPKAYVKEGKRLDKDCQPAGDPDCKLGCKKKANQTSQTKDPTPEEVPTPTTYPQAGSKTIYNSDQYYWGYASGVVATKIPDYGEVVLAELTQPFNKNDTTYFFPLMTATEDRLGFKPPYGALDAAFDTWYVYNYFHQAEGFAAVPFAQRGGYTDRQFDPDGAPLCQAGLPMPLIRSYNVHTSQVHHRKGCFGCPLLIPEPTASACPIDHPHWDKGGCETRLVLNVGARIRYQLDREGDAYKQVYKQRTATERINAQAKALGIERPKLRNQCSISNANTLIYIIINLRAIQRVQAKLKANQQALAQQP
jgi:hypothetical protein